MGIVKKLIAGTVVVSLVGAGLWQGALYIRRSNEKEVMVVKVGSVEESYFAEETALSGTVTSNVSQNISFEKDVIVQNLPVKAGDHVKKGDTLITFDMTLAEMELYIMSLRRALQEESLYNAQYRLYDLENGGSIQENDGNGYGSDSFPSSMDNYTEMADAGENTGWAYSQGPLLAAAFPALLAADIIGDDSGYYGDGGADDNWPEDDMDFDGGADEVYNDDGTYDEDGFYDEDGVYVENESNMNDDNQASQDILSGDQLTSSTPDELSAPGSQSTTTTGGDALSAEPERTLRESTISMPMDYLSQDGDGRGVYYITPTPGPPSSVIVSESSDSFGLMDGDMTFYQELDYASVPYQGSGTKADPFVFLCSRAKSRVILNGSFLNRMAGFSEDGGMLLKEGGYWYLLEFHKNDTISNFSDRRASCEGYYLIDGGMLSRPVNAFSQMELTMEEANKYEMVNDNTKENEQNAANRDRQSREDFMDDIDISEDDDLYESGNDNQAYGVSREEAIRNQQRTIASLELNIRESDLKIEKLEEKIALKEIVARIDGTVAYVGDPVTGAYSGDAFLKVKSEEGFFVTGTVNELMLDKMKVGTKLNCSSYISGSFEAEVLEVSDYPVESSDAGYYGYGNQNPNVSEYQYTARIEDQSLMLSDMDYVNIEPESEEEKTDGIVLERAYVLSENGNNYVYKAENGVLKKAMVRVGSIVNMGYSVLITGGLSRKDWIAFPYGDAKEGAKVREGTVSEFYE